MIGSKREKFREEVLEKIESELFNLDEDIEHNKDSFLNSYEKQIKDVLNDIIQNDLKKLGVISIVLSRVNIDNEDLSYKIYLYGEKLYIDTFENRYNLDVSDVYKYFLNAKKYLYQNVKKYLGLFEPCNVDAEMGSYLKFFNMYIVNLLREIFLKDEVLELLNKVDKIDKFFVIQNEFYEKPYLIYKKEKGD